MVPVSTRETATVQVGSWVFRIRGLSACEQLEMGQIKSQAARYAYSINTATIEATRDGARVEAFTDVALSVDDAVVLLGEIFGMTTVSDVDAKK